ncbi:MAG TPA: hypothetical protein VFG80_10210, partial [Myxococcota bacterium]|nr:hypothetical protein [Myxococcota bacterium]
MSSRSLKSGSRNRLPIGFAVCTLATLHLLLLVSQGRSQQTSGPSGHCHATDGAFSACADSSQEWSDIPATFFPESNSYLYADQADLDPSLHSVHPVTGAVSNLDTFVLMYDECERTTPLGPDEYFLINFDTIEGGRGVEDLERYSVRVFPDDTIVFIEDGETQTNEQGDAR